MASENLGQVVYRDSTRHNDDRAKLAAYWSIAPEQLLTELRASRNGLSQDGAERRLKHYGRNTLQAGSQTTALELLLNQFKSPLVLILVVAVIISVIAREWPDAVIVLAVVLGSTTLGFVQEYRASEADSCDSFWDVENHERGADEVMLRPPATYRQAFGDEPIRVGIVEFRIMLFLASRPYHAFTYLSRRRCQSR
jgi:hypothetical protein